VLCVILNKIIKPLRSNFSACLDAMIKETPLSSQGSSFKLSQQSEECGTSPQTKRYRSNDLANANSLLRAIGLEPLSTKIQRSRRTRYIEKKLEEDKLYMRQWYESQLLPQTSEDHESEMDENISDKDDVDFALSSIGSEYAVLLEEAQKHVTTCSDEARRLQLVSLAPSIWSLNTTANYFKCKTYLVRKARHLRQGLGPCPPCSRRKATVVLSDSLRMNVIDFYRHDEVSGVLSSSKHAVSIGGGNYLPKRLLLSTVAEAHSTFCKDNPSAKIGLSSFSKLRPKDVTLVDQKGVHISSQCKVCVNVRLMLQVQNEIDTVEALIGLAACDPDNERCMSGECGECCDLPCLRETIEEIMADKHSDNVSYKQWKTSSKSCDLLDVVSSVEEYIAALLRECKDTVKIHYFVKKRQQLAMSNMRETLAANEALILMDFAENFSFVTQREISRKYYDRDQCSLHNIIVYRKSTAGLKPHSFCFVSDDRTHDVAYVITSLKMLFAEREDLFAGLNRIHFFTDGAGQHYKSRNAMWFASLSSEIFGVPASWQFHATAHGKGPCDGIGAVVKRQCRRYSLRGLDKPNFVSVKNASGLQKWAEENCTSIKVFLLKTEILSGVRDIMKQVNDSQSAPIIGIKSMHYFISTLPGSITYKRTSSSDGETTSSTTISFTDSMSLVKNLREIK
jgi:hypothetical protein